ncbi:hypothetical protein BD413DRAFT_467059 [Trametes elegans]|nr:hypothetical protein BD413DRAFT_467059 [Trametes elegans]
MKLVVRVQYIGDRARALLREDLASEYTRGLIDDLTYFGFPLPHESKPIEKSGFMLCVYHVDRDSNEHRIVQHAFGKAKAEAATLIDRSIRYISLNEDGVMHTTNLSQKPYKPKTYNKPPPDFQNSQPYQNPAQSYKQQQYGKAPKYPTSISQARHAVSPLGHRMPGDISGPSGHGMDYRDHDMPLSPHSPPGGGSDGANSMIDTTQQTLLQLSQSSAFKSLLQKATPTSTAPVVSRADTNPSTDFSMLLRQPPATSPPQPQIPNLQALLEKAGVKSTSAQALMQTLSPPPHDQYHPSNSSAVMGGAPVASGSNATPVAPSLAAPVPTLGMQPTHVGGLGLSSSAGTSAGAGMPPRPPTTTPRVPTLRELWDIRREITALQARGRNVAADLRAAGQQIPLGPEDATPPTMTSGNGAELLKMRELEAELVALRQQLSRESEARKLAEATLRAERAHRTQVEDMKRECQEPFVVPALLDAFMKIQQMTGDAMKDAPQSSNGSSGGVPMEL